MPDIDQDLRKDRKPNDEAARGLRNPAVSLLVPGADVSRFATTERPVAGLRVVDVLPGAGSDRSGTR